MERARHLPLMAALAGLVVLLILLLSSVGSQAAPTLENGPAVIATIQTGVGDASNGPEGVAVDYERNRIFVSNSKDNTVYVINGDTHQVVTITSGLILTPWGAGYNPNNDRVYVACNGRNSVAIINAATLVVEQEITHGSLNLPDQVVVDALNNRIYVSNSGSDSITVINGANNTVLTSFASGQPDPHAMAVDPSRNRIYVSNLWFIPGTGPDFIVAFTTLTFTEIGRRTALAGPNGMAIRSVDGAIYVAQYYSDTPEWRVAVVDPTDFHFIVGFPGLKINGRNPMGVVYSPGSDRVYVNGYGSNTVDVINASNNTLLTTLPVGANPASGIGLNPNTGRIYVANRGSGSVTVIQDTVAGPTPTTTPAASPTPTATPLCFPDTFEPDDSAAQSKAITISGLKQTRNICPAGDQDWLQFYVPQPVELTLRTENLQGGTDTVLYLFMPDGITQMAYDDDGGGGKTSRIIYSFTKPGLYYAMVKDYDPAAWGTYRRYDVSISGGPPLTEHVYLPVIVKP